MAVAWISGPSIRERRTVDGSSGPVARHAGGRQSKLSTGNVRPSAQKEARVALATPASLLGETTDQNRARLPGKRGQIHVSLTSRDKGMSRCGQCASAMPILARL
jgi:hypothetical protein